MAYMLCSFLYILWLVRVHEKQSVRISRTLHVLHGSWFFSLPCSSTHSEAMPGWLVGWLHVWRMAGCCRVNAETSPLRPKTEIRSDGGSRFRLAARIACGTRDEGYFLARSTSPSLNACMRLVVAYFFTHSLRKRGGGGRRGFHICRLRPVVVIKYVGFFSC